MSHVRILTSAICCLLFLVSCLLAQPGGGPNQPDQAIVELYDEDGNGWLNKEERQVAMSKLQTGGRRRGPRRGRDRGATGKPGPKVAESEAAKYPDRSLYDQTTLRTLFFEFENSEWEKELEAFKPTDVEIPAQLTVDGKVYKDVGVSFRGASSFFSIPAGLKRSLNVSIDFLHEDQRLYGYKSLNLLNCNGDSAMMSSILYSELAGQKVPTPKVNYVKVVINGESWGVYVSSQQFNKTFIKEHFDTKKGARWKVNGSPRGDGGLRYLGDDVEDYKERFEIKSKDKPESWKALIELCRVLNETPDKELEAKLTPILDIDSVLWFLAVDVATVNSDGYWTRASDYNIYLDPKGKFHILPHDMNEAFHIGGGRGGPGGPGGPGGGRGFGPPPGRFGFGGPPPEGGRGPGGFDGPPPRGEREGRGDREQGGRFGGGLNRGGRGGRGGPGGGPGHGGVDLDPLVGLDNERMPLRSVLLNNPKWQRQYLQNIRTLGEQLKWENIGPTVEQHRELISKEVAMDTRKLMTTEAFETATSSEKPEKGSTSLRAFLDQRSEFLLNYEPKTER